MHLSYLREYTVLAEEGSFTKAAQVLGLSQPALSKHMRALEERFGVELIDRSSSALALTPIGKVALEEAYRLTMDYELMCERIGALRHVRPQRLTVSTFQGHRILDDALRVALKSLKKSHPLLEVEIVDCTTDQVVDDIKGGTIDLAILPLRDEGDLHGVQAEVLFREPLVGVVPADAPWEGSLRARDLSGEVAYVANRPEYRSFKEKVAELFSRAGATPLLEDIVWRRFDDLNLFSFREGVYVGCRFATEGNMPESVRERYRILPFEDEDFYFNGCALWKQGTPNDAVPLLLDLIRPLLAKR